MRVIGEPLLTDHFGINGDVNEVIGKHQWTSLRINGGKIFENLGIIGKQWQFLGGGNG